MIYKTHKKYIQFILFFPILLTKHTPTLAHQRLNSNKAQIHKRTTKHNYCKEFFLVTVSSLTGFTAKHFISDQQDQINACNQQINQLEAENKQLNNTQKNNLQEIADLHQQLKTVQNENENHNNENTCLQQDLQKLQTEFEAVQQANTQLNQDNDQISQQLDVSEKNLTQRENKIQQLNQKVLSLRAEVNSKETTINLLNKRINEVDQSKQTFENMRNRNVELGKENQHLKNQIKNLKIESEKKGKQIMNLNTQADARKRNILKLNELNSRLTQNPNEAEAATRLLNPNKKNLNKKSKPKNASKARKRRTAPVKKIKNPQTSNQKIDSDTDEENHLNLFNELGNSVVMLDKQDANYNQETWKKAEYFSDLPYNLEKDNLPDHLDCFIKKYDLQYSKIQTNNKGLVVYLLTSQKRPGEIFITFRGTKCISSMKRDIEIGENWGGAIGLNSLKTNFESIVGSVREKVEGIKQSDQEILLNIYGHSLGGADTQNFVALLIKLLAKNTDKENEPLHSIDKIRLCTRNSPGVTTKILDETSQYFRMIKEIDRPSIEAFYYTAQWDLFQKFGYGYLFVNKTDLNIENVHVHFLHNKDLSGWNLKQNHTLKIFMHGKDGVSNIYYSYNKELPEHSIPFMIKYLGRDNFYDNDDVKSDSSIDSKTDSILS